MDEHLGSLETPDGITLHTRHWAAADPWAAMLVVHGISEHCGRWSHVGSFFARNGIDTHSFDLRGHGRSAGRRMYVDDFSDYADDTAFVAEATVIRPGVPWVLYGHSMGGLIAAGYLLSGRPRPDAAVLSAPALAANVPLPLRVALGVLARVRGGLRISNSIDGAMLSRDPAVGERYLSDPLVDLRTSMKLGKALLDDQARVTERAAELDVPTLVIHGADDALVPPRASAPLAASGAVRRTLYPGLRHELHNEPESESVLADVVAFLRDRLAQAGESPE